MTDTTTTAPPAVPLSEVLPKLIAALDDFDGSHRNSGARKEYATEVADLTRALLTDLDLRAYPAEPETNDASDMLIARLLGVNVMVRRRTADTTAGVETYVHVETDELPDEHRPLVVEVDNSGESTYEGQQ